MKIEQMIEEIREVLFERTRINLLLTLERILVALNYYEKSKIFGFNIGADFETYYITSQENSLCLTLICKWQPNKTLENQSEETIKEIYKILCLTK